jgi:hypothetical protein
VIEIVASQIRTGGYVVNNNAEPAFLQFIRDPANGFISVSLPLKGNTELCERLLKRFFLAFQKQAVALAAEFLHNAKPTRLPPTYETA